MAAQKHRVESWIVNMKKSQIDLSLLKNALKNLQEALNPKNDLERDGAIQRFEYTFELSWKTLARLLESDKPLIDNSVKGILREGGKQQIIENVEAWFKFQEARNKTSHIYEQKVAKEVFDIAKTFPPFCESLLKNIEKRL